LNLITKKKSYKIGETIQVSMYPASPPDLKKVLKYKEKERKIVMDVFSSGSNDALLFSHPGVPSVDSQKLIKYTFSFPVNPAFDSIGNHLISFRYVTSNSESIILENYDSNADELFDDSMILNYTVKAELHLSDVKNPVKAGKLRYGNRVTFSFKVKDTTSGKFILPSSEAYTVNLLLTHKDRHGKAFSSARSPALIVDESKDNSRFQVDWIVNPNAIKGDGYLELVAQIAKDKDMPVLIDNASGASPWKVQVEVGGDITYENDIYNGDLDDVFTVFHIKFTLACQNDLLTGANLIATINELTDEKRKEVITVPVTQGDKPGSYQVSWLLEKSKTFTGTYIVDFAREVDVYRKREGDISDPFFSINFDHEKSSDDGSVFPTEFIVLVLLAFSYGYLSWNKMNIEETRKKR